MKFRRLIQSVGLALLMTSVIFIPSSMAVDLPVTATITSTITETATSNLDFGSIDLEPAGDTITIDADAAGSGTVTPVPTGSSVIVGGGNGVITVASGVAMTVAVTYPATVTITDGTNNLDVVNIDAHSQYGATGDTTGTVSKVAGTDLLIRIGGEIVIPSGQVNATYNGTMIVTLNYS